MGWTAIPVSPVAGVSCTVTKKEVTITVGAEMMLQAGWPDETMIQAFAGDDENEGWLRLQETEAGSPLELSASGAAIIRIPRSVMPMAATCRDAVVLAKVVDGAIEVRIPEAQKRAAVVPAAAAPANARSARVVPPSPPPITNISTPAEYKDLVRECFAAAIEVHFLSDGTVILDGRPYPVAELRNRAARLLNQEKRGEAA